VAGVSTAPDTAIPVANEPLVRRYAQNLVSRMGLESEARVLAIRAQPAWSGPDHLLLSGPSGESARVLVRPCVSSLAIRDAMSALAPSDFLIVLTDRNDADLGLGILARCFNQHVETLNMWVGVEQAFKARDIDPLLRRLLWVAEPLVANAPPGGWPAAPTGILTRDHALSHLTATVLGLEVGELDPSGLLAWTLDPAATLRFREQPTSVQTGLIEWATASIGPVAGLAMGSAATGTSIDAISIGLVADVLWPPSGSSSPDIAAARVRLERWTGARNLPEATARILADSSRGLMQRMAERRDPARPGVLARATALFGDVEYPAGAGLSTVLPAGYDTRLRTLAAQVRAFIAGEPSGAFGVERAFGELLEHEQAAEGRQALVARMAVRLVRWLSLPDPDPATTLLEATLLQARVDAWVDWAAADIWVGSTDPEVAAAWSDLFGAVRARRLGHDRKFAALLADATTRGVLPDGLVPIEALVRDTITPLAHADERVLLVLVDGMSAAVASELVEEACRTQWYEIVPQFDGRRMASLAVLPTLTRYSRTSLFAGQLAAGQQADEKRTFPLISGGGAVFHKSDLVGAAGVALPGPLLEALSSPAPIVAVVLNSVDDALAKHDPGGTDWTLDSVQHLQGLLDEAARSRRLVLLTSDHGHVVERGGSALALAGAEARWRTASSGPVDVGTEVLLRGSRVLSEGGEIIAPYVEDLRYAGKQAGYHGGASAAEVVIPVIALTRQPERYPYAGWDVATPQIPVWWNDPVAAGLSAPAAAPSSRRTPKPGPVEVTGQIGLEVEVPSPESAPVSPLVDQLIASPMYQAQRQRAGARALDDAIVRSIVGSLAESGGRMHQSTLAATAGLRADLIPGALGQLRRLLNLEGYFVISTDPDQVTVLLDVALLREQFLDGAAGLDGPSAAGS
jgi:hypothetical protein